MPRLYHFSDDGSIDKFDPRPVTTASRRSAGMDWLNGPLVWAVDEWHQPMYLFPRECPRILLWPTDETREQDLDLYFGDTSARIVAYIEDAWLARLQDASLYRYELPQEAFQSLEDAGMWVSTKAVQPLRKTLVQELPQVLAQSGVELRAIDSLSTLRDVWDTSLHASGIRLRNAKGWHSLQSPTTETDWEAYHSIRRRVLWEARGRFGVYDDTHPDEYKEGHFPKLLFFGGDPIGVIRIDIVKSVAWFRRVAIRESLQRQGHGSQLMRLAERFAKGHGVSRIQSDVDRDAIPFCERFGFRLMESDGTMMFKDLLSVQF